MWHMGYVMIILVDNETNLSIINCDGHMSDIPIILLRYSVIVRVILVALSACQWDVIVGFADEAAPLSTRTSTISAVDTACSL